MPEGPEVRIMSEKLNSYFAGNTCSSITVFNTNIVKQCPTMPQKLLYVKSRGKKVIFQFETDMFIVAPLMSGRFIRNINNVSHLGFTMTFNNNVIHFEDKRKIAKTYLNFCPEIGPDLLDAAINKQPLPLSLFKSCYQNSRAKIGKLLLDQTKIAGIGNYLKCEILFFSGLDPRRIGKSLSDDDMEILRAISHYLILLAYQHNGLTIQDYLDPDGNEGTYPRSVYQRTDRKDITIERMTIGDGHGTYWCPAYQK